MKFKLWLLLAASAVGATQSAACSSAFKSCMDTRTCAPTAGSSDAEAGQTSDEAAGAPGAGHADGGEHPAPGMSDGGEAGATSDSPALFGACSERGKVACDGHASAQRLACDGAKWQAGTTCSSGTLCDSENGKCVDVLAECKDAEPGQVVCQGDAPFTCGPDLVTGDRGKKCAGLCEGGTCRLARCGDGKVEGDEQCDDGNALAGDGCSAVCAAEPIALALGDRFSCALGSNGVVKCWGLNDHGQLGQGDSDNRGDDKGEMGKNLAAIDLGANRTAKAIAAGGASACALLDDGSVKCWGKNESGQLGTGDVKDRGAIPGELGDQLKPIPLGTGRSATSISISVGFACAVLDNGALKCWGANADGQLGQDNQNAYLDPGAMPTIALGTGRTAEFVSTSDDGFACAVLDNGLLKCWGDNSLQQLCADLDASLVGSAVGDEAGEMSALQGFAVASGRTIETIATGQLTACALLDDGSVKCWGKNYVGEGGTGGACEAPSALDSFAGLDLGSGHHATALSLTYVHSCVLLDDGTLKCFGANDFGQLGALASQTVPLDALALQVATGFYHTCAILADGLVRCWGSNSAGELGLGDTELHTDNGSLVGVKLPAVALTF